MRLARGGYTIVEVIIVLAVSGALFVSAVTMFSGRQGKTQFRQAMEDLDSQIRNFANDVSVSLYPEAGQYSCNLSGGKPVLSNTPSDVATNGNCIFLGRALQADTTTTPGKIYAYTVLGSRINGANTVTTLAQANPSPATSPSTGQLLRDTYTLGANSTVGWSRVNATGFSVPASPSTDLVGLYNNLQPTSGAGRQPVLTYGYSGFTSGGNVRTTIENSTGLTEIQSWFLCIQSGSSNQYARLTVTTTSAGITTKMDYVTNCS